ncbi:MAG: hypothetical protein QOH58_3052 [Thermoleophilaceae bacterium]|jgi:hypothetical protein|nr:hypothetical protein [Thermoleophilaceae bacterium]
MDRYDSDALDMPAGRELYARADLLFQGVDHSGESFEARVFLNNTEADESTPMDDDHGYAGSFVIFGHGGCAGDEGHCEIPELPDDIDDLRFPHPLHPADKPVIVTEALRRVEGDTLTITVVPVLPGEEAPRRADVLFFDRIDILTYE